MITETIELTAETWARLTEPLDTAPPVILTPAARAADDTYRDLDLGAIVAECAAALDERTDEAYEATFGPLDAWLERPAFPVPWDGTEHGRAT